MTDVMTSRERWQAALALEPVDRLPFWPKLDGAYAKAQAAPYNTKSLDELHDWIGSDPHIGIAGCVRIERTRTEEAWREEGNNRWHSWRTPYGELEQFLQFDGPSHSWHPMTFPIRDRADILAMTAFYEDAKPVLDERLLETTTAQVAAVGERGYTFAGIGESPLMYWVEWLAGVEQAHLLLVDYPAEVEALFDAIQSFLVGVARIMIGYSPVEALYLVENTSTTLISPTQYHKYCLPQVGQIAQMASEAGRSMILHMCGHLKALLPDLSTVPVRGFEAFTSPTLGNTSLLEGRTGCPDKALIGGTNAMLWLKPARQIIAKLEEDLGALPHRRGIVVTSGGVMPPFSKPETIRAVCDWVKAYPV